jgi:CheY-like chemotaxis protein
MPILNGYETCSELIRKYSNNFNNFQRPKIFAFTSFINEDIRRRAIEAGFDDVLESPL